MITINPDYEFSLESEDLKDIVKQTIPTWEEADIVITGDDGFDRIELTINGEPYTIRTWDYKKIDEGEWHIPITFFKVISDGNGCGHGEEICCKQVIIKNKRRK